MEIQRLTPTELVQKKLGYKIVHFVKTDTGDTTITNESRKIRLNPMSFPFNGKCRIFLNAVIFGSAPDPVATDFIANLNLSVSQFYAQSNIPYNVSNLLSNNNQTIYSTNLLLDNNVNDLKYTFIDASLTPNSIIELSLVSENGNNIPLTTADSGYIVHLYIKDMEG
jgi:hypothetical protein